MAQNTAPELFWHYIILKNQYYEFSKLPVHKATVHSFSRHKTKSQIEMKVLSILMLLEKSFHNLKYPHHLSPRTHGRQDLEVTMGEKLLSEDIYKIHSGSGMT